MPEKLHELTRFVLALALLAALSCSRPRPGPECSLEGENAVARLEMTAPSAMDVIPVESGFLAAWADGTKVSAVYLDNAGAAVSEPDVLFSLNPDHEKQADAGASMPDKVSVRSIRDLRLERNLKGGFQSAVLVAGTLLGGGSARVYQIGPDLSVKDPPVVLGPAGIYSSGIDSVTSRQGTHVIWHNGAPGRFRIMCSWLPSGSPHADPAVEIGSSDREALSPSFAKCGEDTCVSWATMHRKEAESSASTRIHIQKLKPGCRPAGPADHAAVSGLVDSRPVLAAYKRGVMLFFRDDADSDDRQEYYARPFSSALEPLGSEQRISRCDGPGGIHPAAYSDGFETAVIRTFRHTMLVGLNRITHSGEKKGTELQVYADGTDFVMVRTAQGSDRTLILYSEQGEGARIFSSSVVCR